MLVVLRELTPQAPRQRTEELLLLQAQLLEVDPQAVLVLLVVLAAQAWEHPGQQQLVLVPVLVFWAPAHSRRVHTGVTAPAVLPAPFDPSILSVHILQTRRLLAQRLKCRKAVSQLAAAVQELQVRLVQESLEPRE